MSKKSALYIFIYLFFVYAILNLYASQNFDPLFFHLMTRRQKKDAVAFLKKIQKTPYFTDQLYVFARLYGSSIQNDLQKETQERMMEIATLEAVLEKNGKARDILVKLAILYYENDQPSRAKNYYQQAKNIDLEVKIDQLEVL